MNYLPQVSFALKKTLLFLAIRRVICVLPKKNVARAIQANKRFRTITS